jgi:hypothetical protein
VARHAVDQRLDSGGGPEEGQYVEAQRDVLVRRWPLRRRFLFIVTAAALCWIVPAVIAYLLLARP